jgi:DNA replication protein DnaC
MQNLVKALTTLDDEEREDKVRKYYDCDLLIIDEVFDKNKITLFKSGFQIPFLDQFIRDRIDTYKKGLILISNKPISEIDREGFGYSLQDFIERRVILKKTQFNFEDNYMSGINIKNIQGVFD